MLRHALFYARLFLTSHTVRALLLVFLYVLTIVSGKVCLCYAIFAERAIRPLSYPHSFTSTSALWSG